MLYVYFCVFFLRCMVAMKGESGKVIVDEKGKIHGRSTWKS